MSVESAEEELNRWHQTMAASLFNRAWELLDQAERTPEQEEEMMAAAFGSRFHWGMVGTPRHLAIGDWQIARVLAVVGEAELAARFGDRSLQRCVDADLDPFVTAYAHEALARAADEVDDFSTRDAHLRAARDLAAQIQDVEDRRLLIADLDNICEPEP